MSLKGFSITRWSASHLNKVFKSSDIFKQETLLEEF